MKSVGIRELKNKLSEYVRQVRSGETILVTDRGEVVAEMNPPGQGNVDRSLPPGLIELARKGLVRVAPPHSLLGIRFELGLRSCTAPAVPFQANRSERSMRFISLPHWRHERPCQTLRFSPLTIVFAAWPAISDSGFSRDEHVRSQSRYPWA